MDRRQVLAGAAATVLPPAAVQAAAPSDLQLAARDAWIAVLPLIEMAALRTRMLNPKAVGQHAGVNAFKHTRRLVDPSGRAVTTPNNDTLYSSSFVDLTAGPVELRVPSVGSRYLSVAVMDMYTNNNVILGRRTPGGSAGTYRLVGPGHTPEAPHDLNIATPHAWVLARVLVDGESDLPAVHAVQDQLILSGPSTPAPPAYATRASDWTDYFRAANALLKTDPPSSTKGMAAFDRVRSAGRGSDFALEGYSAADAAAIAAGVTQARNLIQAAPKLMKFIQGWSYPQADLGDYGDDVLYRAFVAVGGLGALKPQEAMYMRAEGDGGGTAFQGDGLYRFSLPTPIPVDGFWSLTMYEATPDGQFFLTENAINRFAIGDRTPGLRRGPGGALDIWISRTDPGGERTSNWLPAPKAGPFAIFLRAYLPRPELLTGAYRVPAVVAVAA